MARPTKRQLGWKLIAAFRKDGSFERLLELQGGHCALCPSTGGKTSLNIDHDHAAVEVRGLLCPGCNRALPEYKDADWLERAAEYKRNPPARRLLT